MQTNPQEQKPEGTVPKFPAVAIAVPTLLYWLWESRTGGNIRVDLLLIYPALCALYISALWKRYRFWSLLFAVVLMAANFAFFIVSYDLFNKNPG